jgi:chromosome partitioning protein
VFELPHYLAWQDWEHWQPLNDWLESAASRP